jgi:hypothetical protein
MHCQQLVKLIEDLQPEAPPRDVARVCLLLANMVEDIDRLAEGDNLAEAWQEIGLRLQIATDQHAAMTEELEALANSDPQQFSAEQIWILVRAIKVQSQVLQLYLGQSAFDV